MEKKLTGFITQVEGGWVDSMTNQTYVNLRVRVYTGELRAEKDDPKFEGIMNIPYKTLVELEIKE